jgi:hypothetical protein
MNGVSLGARFSLATNQLEYCGPQGASPLLYGAITRGEALEAAGRTLLQFEALGVYLEALAAKHHGDPLSEDVFEAYWIGNPLLDAFEERDFLPILEGLVRRGLPRRLADSLAARLPKGAIPHHVFHVCYVGVGNVTGHVATTLANMEACRTAWGRVISIEGSQLVLRKSSLVAKEGALDLGPEQEVTVKYDPLVLPDVRVGSEVALHWNWPALVLSSRQRASLERYTRASLAAASLALPPALLHP